MFIVGRTVARGSRSSGFLEHRLELRERSLFRVKRMRYAQGDRLVALPVTKRRAEYDGNADGGEALGHRFVPAVVVLAGSGEVAYDEPDCPRERSREQELRAQAVGAVWRFVESLEQDDRAAKAGLQRRAAQRREDRKIPAANWSFDSPTAHRARGPPQRLRRFAMQQRIQPCRRTLLFAELRAHRPVDARDAGAGPDLVQDRRVAVSNDGLGDELTRNRRRDAQKPVTTARQHDRARRRIAERAQQLVEAARVRSGEVSDVARVDALAESRLESHLLQRAHAALESVAIERARRRHDCDAVALAQRWGTRHRGDPSRKVPPRKLI